MVVVGFGLVVVVVGFGRVVVVAWCGLVVVVVGGGVVVVVAAVVAVIVVGAVVWVVRGVVVGVVVGAVVVVVGAVVVSQLVKTSRRRHVFGWSWPRCRWQGKANGGAPDDQPSGSARRLVWARAGRLDRAFPGEDQGGQEGQGQAGHGARDRRPPPPATISDVAPAPPRSDADLVEAVRSGDTQAFSELYRAHAGTVPVAASQLHDR